MVVAINLRHLDKAGWNMWIRLGTALPIAHLGNPLSAEIL